jgi:uncharacterized Zn-finger protein
MEPSARNEKPVDLLCPHCGQAFSAFLQEMAEHNGEVTCPTCGKAHHCGPADAGKASSSQK